MILFTSIRPFALWLNNFVTAARIRYSSQKFGNVRNETLVFMNLYSIFVLPTDSIILRVYFNSQSSKVYKMRNLYTLLVVVLYFNILTEFNLSYWQECSSKFVVNTTRQENTNDLPFV